MPSMTYCRHENTLSELRQVQELWDDYDGGNEYEDRARRRLVEVIREMHEQFVSEGTYDEMDES